jgi:hypothetical protein
MVNFASPVEILINIIFVNCNFVAWHRIDDTYYILEILGVNCVIEAK